MYKWQWLWVCTPGSSFYFLKLKLNWTVSIFSISIPIDLDEASCWRKKIASCILRPDSNFAKDSLHEIGGCKSYCHWTKLYLGRAKVSEFRERISKVLAFWVTWIGEGCLFSKFNTWKRPTVYDLLPFLAGDRRLLSAKHSCGFCCIVRGHSPY